MYCLAVGQSKLDHTLVIDHYVKEVEELMSGVDVDFVDERRVKTVSLGILVYLADRLERSDILQTTKGGILENIPCGVASLTTRSCRVAIIAYVGKLSH